MSLGGRGGLDIPQWSVESQDGVSAMTLLFVGINMNVEGRETNRSRSRRARCTPAGTAPAASNGSVCGRTKTTWRVWTLGRSSIDEDGTRECGKVSQSEKYYTNIIPIIKTRGHGDVTGLPKTPGEKMPRNQIAKNRSLRQGRNLVHLSPHIVQQETIFQSLVNIIITPS